MPGLVNAHTHVADDAAARPGRRPAARRLADGLHDAGRARVRQPRLRPARHAARLRRDDPVRRDLLRRHVLLRGGGRRGHGRGRHARAVRADGAALSHARRDELRGLAGARARLHRAVARPSADRSRRRRRTRPTPARRRSCARAPSSPSSSTCRSTSTCRRRRWRWRIRGGSTACRSCRGSRSRACSTPRCWPRTACTWTTGEMRALKNSDAGVAHNPTSNLKLGAGVAPVARMLELGVERRHRHRRRRRRTTTSTCSRRCGWRRCSPRASSGDPTALPARDALAMATRLGAARDAHGSPDRIARARQARRPDRASISIALHNVPAFGRDPDGIYAPDRLRRRSRPTSST